MKSLLNKAYHYWKTNLVMILFSTITLVFMEWLFITTKPSFLSGSSIQEKITVLLMSIVLVFGVLILVSIPFLLYCSLFPSNIKTNAFLIAIIPAIVLASSALLMIDNFTYTIFKFGVFTTSGISKAIYLFFWCLIFLVIFLKLKRKVKDMIQKSAVEGIQTLFLPILMIAFSCTISLLFIRIPTTFRINHDSNVLTNPYPNIVLFTADGVNAENMSLYGYERETTPFLDSIKEDLIISQNHFTNSANTTGSIISMMTGKYPTTSRVLYPPDILRGQDSVEHFPGILKDLGYYTAQFAIDHFVDSSTQNLQDSFDESNEKQIQAIFTNKYINSRFPEYCKLFLNEIELRLITRIKHIFFIRAIENTFLQITLTQKNFDDTKKIVKAIDVIKNKSEPAFIHIHWMGTHGGKFFPDTYKYSSGIDRDNQSLWDVNLYDDAIIDVDKALKFLFKELSDIGELENTIVIFTSDHGQRFTVINRLPLLIFNPHSNGLPLPLGNTQNIDIAPTILDLLNYEQPGWMLGGRSIFADNQVGITVVSTGTNRVEDTESGWGLNEIYLTQPFYQFDYLNVIYCDRFYKLNLEDLYWSNGVVSSYDGVCPEKNYAFKNEIRLLMIDRLIEDGFEFDQSTIPEIP